MTIQEKVDAIYAYAKTLGIFIHSMDCEIIEIDGDTQEHLNYEVTITECK